MAADKALSSIREAEARARDVISGASDEAALIIKKAGEEAAAALTEFSAELKKRASENKRLAENEADERSAEFAKETEALRAELKNRLSVKKPAAVGKVAEAVKNR